MEDMYGLYSTGGAGDYYYCGGPADDRTLMFPESSQLPPPPPPPPPEYPQEGGFLYPSGGAGGFRDYHSGFPGYDVFGSDELVSAVSEAASINIGDHHNHHHYHHHHHSRQYHHREEDDEESAMKAKIKSHPSYPRLLQAYIECQKVGAPPEIASLLEEIRRESNCTRKRPSDGGCLPSCSLGTDPELDEFMETYIDMLVKYKSDLERPFDEATTFLNKIEMQLSNLSTTSLSDEGFASSDEELSGGEVEASMDGQPRTEDRGLKDRLLRRFGSQIRTLKLEFSKKKKKGKLPKEARQTLLNWWNVHNKWPYPTEADKKALADVTGLDQKQINNWFINQRKRHWKPSENMQFGPADNFQGHFYSDE
ncbi:hypothetical protein SAY87_025009 [Trapa incisa]|uniref:Homeobox domain-containing protein n=1 Tax=Trapa incisa TaxID=236973 RepID=A0AAN7GDU6_9MYRT|nr:hypothetical protein SAY87_025009 [Trapa incisa]